MKLWMLQRIILLNVRKHNFTNQKNDFFCLFFGTD